MTFETYISFFLLSLVFMVIPGPTVLLVASQALTSGRRSVLPLVAGVGLGDLLAMSLSFAGIGAVLAASAFWFSLLKWAGAIYLIYLGIRAWRRPLITDADARKTSSREAQFLSAFLTTALNPKSIVFFIAFMPQFVSPASPALPQFMLLGASYLGIGMLNAAGYAIFAGHLHGLIKGPGLVRHFNRLGASVLIGAGLLTAAVKRNQ